MCLGHWYPGEKVSGEPRTTGVCPWLSAKLQEGECENGALTVNREPGLVLAEEAAVSPANLSCIFFSLAFF